jgi:hypothetical protein
LPIRGKNVRRERRRRPDEPEKDDRPRRAPRIFREKRLARRLVKPIAEKKENAAIGRHSPRSFF